MERKSSLSKERSQLPTLKRYALIEQLRPFSTTSFRMLASSLVWFGLAFYIHESSARIIDPGPFENEIEDDVCFTPGCVQAAADALSSLDDTVDPCDDFYRFACGGWLAQHDIPGDKALTGVLYEMNDNVMLQLKALLEKEIEKDDPEFAPVLKTLYGSCTDLASIEIAGGKPLKKVLAALGGWPVVEGSKWNEAEFDWIDTLIDFRKIGLGYDTLMKVYLATDFTDSTVTLDLIEPVLGVPSTLGLTDPKTAVYFNMMVESAKLLGADEATVEDELLKVLQFETALESFSSSSEEARDFTSQLKKYTVDELQRMVPQIPWLKYFNGMLVDERIDGNEPLVMQNPDFFVKLADLISRTDKRVVANYVLWRAVAKSLPLLSRSFRDLSEQYSQAMSGRQKEQSRWETCVDTVKEFLGTALSSYYVRNYFKEESRDAALELVGYLRSEFKRTLAGADWMDEKTKKRALEKAGAMQVKIGYSDDLLNITAVMEGYENLSLKSKSYFENVLGLQKWEDDKLFASLRIPLTTIKGAWNAEATTINAHYNPYDNSIEFPAAILQKPIFSKDKPKYMNFGAGGMFIGHEITHGFDDKGKKFDKDGNHVNWWDETTDKRFQEKVQCMIDQYSNYTVGDKLKANGFLTVGDDIADNGGLRNAYNAYRSWVKGNGREPRLPGMKYSQNQLFWLSAAQIWCGKYRQEVIEFIVSTSDHSLPQFRVIGPMSNLPEFSEDFNCPPDAPMNRKKKCRVW